MTFEQHYNALALLGSGFLLMHCMVHRDGTSVDLTVMSASPSSASDAPNAVVIEAPSGDRVTILRAYVVLSRVELVACSEASVWKRMQELWAPAIAHAHGRNTLTAWAIPNVIAPIDIQQRETWVADLHPPAGRYCTVRVSFDAADSDAEALPSDVSMVGRSLRIEGHYSAAGELGSHLFSYECTGAVTRELPLLDDTGAPTQLELRSEQLRATIRIEFTFDDLFDGVDLIPGTDPVRADLVLQNALAHTRARLSLEDE